MNKTAYNFFLELTFVTLSSLLTGSLIWCFWPYMHNVFPTAASSGIIVKDLLWWDSVCVSGIITTLFKAVPKKLDK